MALKKVLLQNPIRKPNPQNPTTDGLRPPNPACFAAQNPSQNPKTLLNGLECNIISSLKPFRGDPRKSLHQSHLQRPTPAYLYYISI